jgi:hypothetical protein
LAVDGLIGINSNQWIPVLLLALLAALRTLGDAPTRSLTALAQRLGVSEADTATMVAPLEEASAPVVAAPAGVCLSKGGKPGDDLPRNFPMRVERLREREGVVASVTGSADGLCI